MSNLLKELKGFFGEDDMTPLLISAGIVAVLAVLFGTAMSWIFG